MPPCITMITPNPIVNQLHHHHFSFQLLSNYPSRSSTFLLLLFLSSFLAFSLLFLLTHFVFSLCSLHFAMTSSFRFFFYYFSRRLHTCWSSGSLFPLRIVAIVSCITWDIRSHMQSRLAASLASQSWTVVSSTWCTPCIACAPVFLDKCVNSCFTNSDTNCIYGSPHASSFSCWQSVVITQGLY